MLEAPEARILAEQINSTLKGKTIELVETLASPHRFAWFYGDPAEYEAHLAGKTIDSAVSWGGQVEIRVGDRLLLLCDGVNALYHGPGSEIPGKHQLLLGFTDGSFVTVSVRMYAGIWSLPAGETPPGFGFQPYYDSARTKPQVLSDNFTREYFFSLVDRETGAKKTAKALLATGQTIPGLGNGVLQDILFRCGINPKTKIAKLTSEDFGRMYDAVKQTLSEMYEKGGRCTETDLHGRKGGYFPVLSKDTVGTDCPVCARTIVKESYLGGSIYYCPGCQPVNK